MELKETFLNLVEALPLLNLPKHSQPTGSGEFEIYSLNDLRTTLLQIADINAVADIVGKITSETRLFRTAADAVIFPQEEFNVLNASLAEIQKRIKTISIFYSQSVSKGPEIIEIKLPPLHSFDDLEKAANDLKKAIQIPIMDSKLPEANVTIVGAERGSIWLEVSLATVEAVSLVALLSRIAAKVRKEHALAKVTEEHARRMKLSNDVIEDISKGAIAHYNAFVTGQVKEIVAGNVNFDNPQAIQHLELSIKTLATFMEKGGKILPASSDPETKKQFPTYIESSEIDINKRIKDAE